MAICYYKLGEYDNAIACYDAITDLRKKETRAYFLREASEQARARSQSPGSARGAVSVYRSFMVV